MKNKKINKASVALIVFGILFCIGGVSLAVEGDFASTAVGIILGVVLVFVGYKRLYASKDVAAEKKEEAPELDHVEFEQRFMQNDGFAGHKRFYVSYYGYKPAENGLAKLKKSCSDLSSPKELKNAEIILRTNYRNGEMFVDVNVNGCLIGSVIPWYCDDYQIDYLNNVLFKGFVDSAHIRVEHKNVAGKNDAGEYCVERRENIYLFLKAEGWS